MMATLSLPDDRDATRLPYQPLPWGDVAATPVELLRGLRQRCKGCRLDFGRSKLT